MRIEDEIKQSKFQSEYHKLAINILFTSNWLFSIHAKNLKPYGISPQQYNILRILRGQYPNSINVNDLSCRMLDKSSNVTRLIDKLIIKKLALRATCEEDRRKFNISITEKGLELLKTLDPLANSMDSKLDFIDENQAKQFNDFLDKIRDNK